MVLKRLKWKVIQISNCVLTTASKWDLMDSTLSMEQHWTKKRAIVKRDRLTHGLVLWTLIVSLKLTESQSHWQVSIFYLLSDILYVDNSDFTLLYNSLDYKIK